MRCIRYRLILARRLFLVRVRTITFCQSMSLRSVPCCSYDSGVISSVLTMATFKSHFHNPGANLVGAVVSTFNGGCFIGAAAGGWCVTLRAHIPLRVLSQYTFRLNDKLGRRLAIQVRVSIHSGARAHAHEFSRSAASSGWWVLRYRRPRRRWDACSSVALWAGFQLGEWTHLRLTRYLMIVRASLLSMTVPLYNVSSTATRSRAGSSLSTCTCRPKSPHQKYVDLSWGSHNRCWALDLSCTPSTRGWFAFADMRLKCKLGRLRYPGMYCTAVASGRCETNKITTHISFFGTQFMSTVSRYTTCR
jgi:hypothetical protein